MSTKEAKARAKNKYNAKAYEQVIFRLRKDEGILTKEKIIKEAEATGESLNTFITQAILERIERLNDN